MQKKINPFFFLSKEHEIFYSLIKFYVAKVQKHRF